jgi:hypothetical protein
MRVDNWEIKEKSDTVEISADIDGYRLWFRSPRSYKVSRAGDPFLASALIPAMHQAEALEIDPDIPVSPKLLENVKLLQEIFHSWNPEELRIIPIIAETRPAEPLNGGIMSFFSGGVDSMYTFLKQSDVISHAVFMHGMDFYHSDDDSSSFTVNDIKDLAQFAWRLMLSRDPVSAYLKSMLSNTTLEVLSNYEDSCSDPSAIETALVKDLNNIISGESIYEKKRFRRIALRPETRQLLKDNHGNPQPDKRCTLNKLLLEDAFPQEIPRKHNGTFKKAIERNARFVQSFGKTLIPVEHNHYSFGYRYNLSRDLSQAGVLGSVALLLGFPVVYVPSSFPYSQLFPLGSHPLTDPLWSNECTEVMHDGCEAKRIDKLKKICESKPALENLRVCTNDQDENCGKCEKCLYTMIPLKVLNAYDAPFPPLPSLRTIWVGRHVDPPYLKENADLAKEAGNKKMYRILLKRFKRNELLQIFIEIDRVLIGGFFKRSYQRIAPGINRIYVQVYK